MLLTPAQIKPKSFESRRNSSFFSSLFSFFLFTRGGCASCYGRAWALPQSYQYPNLSEGDDRVGGQLRGDKECPFSGVTKSGKVWRKVPESGAQGVGCFQRLISTQTFRRALTASVDCCAEIKNAPSVV